MAGAELNPALPGRSAPEAATAPADGTELAEWFLREFDRYSPAPELFQIAPTAFRFLVDLRKSGAEGVECVLDALDRGNSAQRLLATRLLGFLDGERPRQKLKELALFDDDSYIASEAARSLAVVDEPDVIADLRELLRARIREGVLINVIYGLCRHGCADGFQLAAHYLLDERKPRAARVVIAAHVAMLRRADVVDFLDQAAACLPEERALIHQIVLCCRAVRTPAARDLLARIASNTRVAKEERNHAAAATAETN